MIYLIEVTVAIDSAGTTQIFRFSSKGYITEPTDSPANAYYEPRVINPASINRNIFSDGKTSGASRVGYGSIELSNIDGGLDYLRSYSFDGRSLIIKVGDENSSFSSYTTILNGTMEQVEFTFSKAIILIRDKLSILDNPLQTTLYLGNNSLPNGVEGVSDIAKKPKPLLYGKVFNIQPIMVNSSLLIYQINDGAIAAVGAVYDRGVALTFHADEPNVADLEAHSPPSGKYTTCLALGHIRIGNSPSGALTCDATQGATLANRTAAQILKLLAIKGGVDSGDIVASDVTALDALNSSEVGIWVDINERSIDVMDAISNSIGAYFGFNSNGQFKMGRFTSPSGTPVINIDLNNLINIDYIRPDDAGKGIPTWRTSLTYQKNYTIQSTDLATSITDARRNVLNIQSLTVSAEDPAIKDQYVLATELTRETLLTNSASAQTEANRLLALYKVRRELYSVKIALDLNDQLPDLNNVINLILPRFGLTSGKIFTIIGIDANYATNRATLTLWG
jgi:hypothetical protein